MAPKIKCPFVLRYFFSKVSVFKVVMWPSFICISGGDDKFVYIEWWSLLPILKNLCGSTLFYFFFVGFFEYFNTFSIFWEKLYWFYQSIFESLLALVQSTISQVKVDNSWWVLFHSKSTNCIRQNKVYLLKSSLGVWDYFGKETFFSTFDCKQLNFHCNVDNLLNLQKPNCQITALCM